MRRLFYLLLAMLLLTGCGKKQTVDLMPGAEPETSALTLYVYDGETIMAQFLFETAGVREKAMTDFHKAKAEPAEVDVTTLQPPFYGLEMGGEEQGTIHGLWADGYFIRDDGTSYRFEYDFEKLLAGYPWENGREYENLALMPCACHMAKTETGWNLHFLTGAEEPQWPNGVEIELVEQTAEDITVRLVNNSGREWGYGYGYRLEVLLEDRWYRIPAEREMAFVDVLMLLQPDGDQVEIYSLEAYGELPDGIYRLVVDNGLWVEFDVKS